MGAGASVDGMEVDLAAFKEIKKAYDIVGARNLPDDELVEFLQHKVIESLTTGIEADFESEEKRPGNESFRRKELQKILDSDNHGVREAHLGDIVKVKDEGFFVEGVIVAMTATDNTVFAMVDFGLDYISTEFREFEAAQKQKEIEFENLSPRSAEEQEKQEALDQLSPKGDDVGIKLFPVRDLIITMCAEEMELGDQVEVRTEGQNLFFLGHICNISRKYNALLHTVDLTYDVEMDGNKEGVMLETQRTDEDHARIDMEVRGHHEQKAEEHKDEDYDPMQAEEPPITTSNSNSSIYDIEYNVKPKNIRKLLSGRIRTMHLWKRAWRKVSALIKFRQGGLGLGLSGKGSSMGSSKVAKK